MRRGLPKDTTPRDAHAARVRRAKARAGSPRRAPNGASWWHHAVLWLAMLATLPAVRVPASAEWPASLEYVRAAVIDHSFAAPSPEPVTSRENLVAGPAFMWAPFFLAANAGVEVARRRGSTLPADGRAWPYPMAAALGTAIYGFVALWLSYRIALRFAPAGAALFATITMWLATCVPMYIYAQPFAPYVAAMFSAALMLTWWLAIRDGRDSRGRWLFFGMAAGLAVSTSLLNISLLVVVAVEIGLRLARGAVAAFVNAVIFTAGWALIAGPALWLQRGIDGGWLLDGHSPIVHWTSPHLMALAFSSRSGAFVWTPVLLLAAVGLVATIRRERSVGLTLTLTAAAAFYLAAAVLDSGGGAFGAPRLIAVLPIGAAGLAALFAVVTDGRGRLAVSLAVASAIGLIVWNLGLMLQWSAGLIPANGAIDWRQTAINQVRVVPHAAWDFVIRYANERKGLVSESGPGARE